MKEAYTDPLSQYFDRDLLNGLWVDLDSLEGEHDKFQSTITDLEKWETEYVGMDGNFQSVREKTEDGGDVFTNHPDGEAALIKYSSVLENLPHMMIRNITTWEIRWLDTSGKLNVRATKLSDLSIKNGFI